MPCDSRILIDLDMKNTDPKVFTAAMKRLGWTVVRESGQYIVIKDEEGYQHTFDCKTGEVSTTSNQKNLEDIKRAYTRECTIQQVQKAGWKCSVDAKNKWKVNASK